MQKISVIIPVKNGAGTLEKCLISLRTQTVGTGLEIILADSMSVDNSREIANRFNVKIIDIPVGTFDHGLTRNLAANSATGDLVFFTVQDAWLGNNVFLEKMASHFTDSSVMGVVGHQAVPHDDDKNPLLWFRPVSAPAVTVRKVDDWTAFKNLPQHKQQELVSWDNVVAMYRREAITTQPFVQTGFAEDWIWSYEALCKGWTLLHDSSLVVYHYHHQSFKYAFRSRYTVNYHFYKFFKYTPVLTELFVPIIKSLFHLVKNKKLTFGKKIYWFLNSSTARFGDYFSTLNFLIRLKFFGSSGIEKGYDKYCEQIPQGRQK